MADYHVKLPTGEEYDITGAADDADPMQLLGESLGTGQKSEPTSPDVSALAPDAEVKPRGLGESLYDRTIGEATRQADQLAATLRDPDVHPMHKAYELGKSGLQGVFTAAFPEYTALAKGAGAGTEAATGSKELGDVAEVAAPLVAGGGQLAAAGTRGIKGLMGGGTLAEEVAGDVGAGTTAQEAGKTLQAPREGARKAIGTVSDEASAKYKAAQDAADAADAVHSADDKSLIKAASQARSDTKAAGGTLPPEPRRTIGNILRAGRGQTSKLVDASGNALSTPAVDTPVSTLIDEHSNLSRQISKLPFNHPARAPLLDFKSTLEDAIDKGASGSDAADAWQEAKDYYRDVAAPTKKTAGKALKAETPEQAARGIMGKNTPSRFSRIQGAAPEAAEALRSSAWTDALDKATVDGKLDLTRLSAQLPKDPTALSQWANTPARQLAVKAIQKASRVEKAGGTAGSVAMAGGALEFGLPGFLGGYAVRKVFEKALTSEPVARAMYRLYTATEGGPAYKLAAKVIAKHMGPAVATSGTRASALLDQEQE